MLKFLNDSTMAIWYGVEMAGGVLAIAILLKLAYVSIRANWFKE